MPYIQPQNCSVYVNLTLYISNGTGSATVPARTQVNPTRVRR